MTSLPALQDAVALQRAGRLAEAEQLCLGILQTAPDAAPARHLLGMIQLQQGRAGEALASLDAALARAPGAPAILASRGLALQANGRLEDALASLDGAVAAAPGDATTWYNRGMLLRQMKRPEAALQSYDKALALRPSDVKILNNRGNILRELQRPREALECFEQGLALKPGDDALQSNRAAALFALARYADALGAIDGALANRPRDTVLLQRRTETLVKLGKPEDVVQTCDRILSLNPKDSEALSQRGLALDDLQRHDEAVASFRAALAIDPNLSAARNNLGVVLSRLGDYEGALASFDAGLARDPQNAELLYNRGNTLCNLKRFAEAIENFETTLALHPGHPYAFGSLAGTALSLCDWTRTGQLAAEIAAHPEKFVQPLTLLGYSEDPARLLASARRATQAWVPAQPRPLWDGAPYDHDKIRLAYLSAHFNDHATAWLTAELFETHDRQRFHLTAISYRPGDGGAMAARLARAFDRFVDVSRQSDAQVARLLREMEIDVAVDLDGYTLGGRPAILSHRPAPVQVNYLGFPGSTGAPFIDYIIADPVLLPLTEQEFYDEKIVQLPDSYQPNDTRRVTATNCPGRAAAGLPAAGFVFCCFNNSWKITPPLFDIWISLLAAVPGSVLWLLDDNPAATANLKREAEKRGIDPQRLVFAPRTDQQAHLARHRLADLFLDTLPCNAHTTAGDALWSGLPVLTCAGKSFAGRVAASLLHAAGLPELVREDLDSYGAFALKLASEPQLFEALRGKMAGVRASPLFDIQRYRRNLEAAYIQMWRMAESGTPPRGFAVGASELQWHQNF
jgi:predicted O-linked N-acetylglucosamine transferase (SPINDLY family)